MEPSFMFRLGHAPQMNRVLYTILNPYCVFYMSNGVPPVESAPPLPTDDDDAEYVDVTWMETAAIGDKVDYLSPAVETWATAEILNISPTRTEVELSCAGTRLWVSVEDGKVAPAGEGAMRKLAAAEAKAAVLGASGTAPPPDESWRLHLSPGYLCDVYSTLKIWYQSVVLAVRVVNGTETVKV
jgi:hypothetical protein